MKILSYILHGAFLLIIVGAGTVFFTPSLPYVGSVQMKIVKSGSMEPSIMTGAVVLIRPKTSYVVGDVITFADENASIPTTHRIVESYTESGQTMFATKGDANEENDALHVSASSVIGSVAFSVPYVGYVIDFARQPIGFSLLIVMPALLIILGELDKIRKEIWGRRREGKKCVKREVLEPAPARRGESAPHYFPRQKVCASTQTLDLRGFGQTVTYADDVDTYSEPKYVAEPFEHSVRYLDAHTLDLRRYMPAPGDMRESVRQAPYFPNWAMPLLIVTVGLALAGANFIPYTMSYFSDTESSIGNVFRAGMFAVAEPFNFSVTPSNTCFTYNGSTLNTSATYAVTPDTVTSYDIAIRNVGDDKLCDRIGVATGTMAPVLISNFGASALSGPTTLAFTQLEPLMNGNRWCNADIVFSTIHDGVQYWATSTLQINDSSVNNSNKCPTTQEITSKATEQSNKKDAEIGSGAVPEENTNIDGGIAEEGDTGEDFAEQPPVSEDSAFEGVEDTQTGEEDTPKTEEGTNEPVADENVEGGEEENPEETPNSADDGAEDTPTSAEENSPEEASVQA